MDIDNLVITLLYNTSDAELIAALDKETDPIITLLCERLGEANERLEYVRDMLKQIAG